MFKFDNCFFIDRHAQHSLWDSKRVLWSIVRWQHLVDLNRGATVQTAFFFNDFREFTVHSLRSHYILGRWTCLWLTDNRVCSRILGRILHFFCRRSTWTIGYSTILLAMQVAALACGSMCFWWWIVRLAIHCLWSYSPMLNFWQVLAWSTAWLFIHFRWFLHLLSFLLWIICLLGWWLSIGSFFGSFFRADFAWSLDRNNYVILEGLDELSTCKVSGVTISFSHLWCLTQVCLWAALHLFWHLFIFKTAALFLITCSLIRRRLPTWVLICRCNSRQFGRMLLFVMSDVLRLTFWIVRCKSVCNWSSLTWLIFAHFLLIWIKIM